MPLPFEKFHSKLKKQTKIYKHFEEYCNTTTIHGVRYLVQHDRNLTERLLWLVIILLSLCCCLYLIFETYKKWQIAPVITTFATSQVPISEILFPAVTICPEAKAKVDLYNLTETLLKIWNDVNLTEKEEEELGFMYLICLKEVFLGKRFNDSQMNQRILKFYAKVGLDLEEVVPTCTWMNSEYCSNILVPILTEVGVCFTFNILDRSQIYKDTVVQFEQFHSVKNTASVTYPKKATSAGKGAGLDATLCVNRQNLNPYCGLSLHGFRVLLHQTSEIPRMSHRYFHVPLDTIVFASVKPDVIATDKALKNYDKKVRKCYFPNEKQLRFFKLYTQGNCEIECLTNFTLKECDCVNFYMPRERSMAICGPGKADCLNFTQGRYLTEEACECLPSCNAVTYDVEISQSPWNWIEMFTFAPSVVHKAAGKNVTNLHYSNLVVFFKEMQFISKERHALYGYMDFFANCGGLLGLFVGFSVLSAVEILYHFTVKLFLVRNGPSASIKAPIEVKPAYRRTSLSL